MAQAIVQILSINPGLTHEWEVSYRGRAIPGGSFDSTIVITAKDAKTLMTQIQTEVQTKFPTLALGDIIVFGGPQ